MASDRLIVVEKVTDLHGVDTHSRVVTAEEFISERGSVRGPRKVINLCRNYDYLSLGYYCSLLAEARGDRVTPSVETILDLQHHRTQQASPARRRSPALRHSAPRMDLAILHDPSDPLPPSNLATLQRIVEVGQSMNIGVELIRKKDYSRLTQFDALFIRETTAVAHHTFEFAKKAAAEGMPVIDDPGSILRCTNKAFLAELLRENGISTPRTQLVSRRTLARFENTLSYPVVLKVPDGSFSRDVKKAHDFAQFTEIAQAMFKESEIVLVQDFMYTAYDWRVGVLAGAPLFVARYHMVRDHWQIIKHSGAGQSTEGRTEAVALHDTPKCVLDTALSAARLIGDGFYGVDLKQTDAGAFVIEINDNPNLDVGAEDKVLGDEVYRRLLAHLLARFESRKEITPWLMTGTTGTTGTTGMTITRGSHHGCNHRTSCSASTHAIEPRRLKSWRQR